ncbi:MAG: IPT/TIG domain-containing protein [Planctomycetota bacterium]
MLKTMPLLCLVLGALCCGAAHAAQAPTVSGLSPASGPTNGGTNIAITGTNFVSGATVDFAGAQASNVNFVSTKRLTATTPASATVGAVSVNVTNPDGQVGTLASGFTYSLGPAPTVSSVLSPSGPTNGGTDVTITGANFADGATVAFGGVQAQNVNFVGPTQLTATTATHVAGAVDVNVINPDGQVGTLASGFTYSQAPAPTVSSISPASGPTNGGTNIAITGTGFADGATVDFAGAQLQNVNFVSATRLTATTPSSATVGAVNVNVTNPDGQVGTLANGFTYSLGPAPTVSSVLSPSGPTNGGTDVTITGANFTDGATVAFGGVQATNVNFVGVTQLTATTPAHVAGAVDVNIINPDGQVGTLASGFTYSQAPAPAVSGIAPSSGPTGGGTNITITGTGFADGAAVDFAGAQSSSVDFVSATQLTATAPASATVGAVNVNVTNPDGQVGTLANGFTYSLGPAPTVSALSPVSGPTNGGTNVAITGANFTDGATVDFAGAQLQNVNFVSATRLTATTPASAGVGAVNVNVTNPDGQVGTLANGFTYSLGPAPTVSSVLLPSGPTNGGTDVTITGANFADGATVAFGGVQAANIAFVSATQLTATTATHAAGAVDVNVINPDGQAGTLAKAFTYSQAPTPTVSALSPASGPTNGGTNITITGTNFADGAIVAFGDLQISNVNFVSATQLTAATPASAGVGAVNVNVTNPDGQVGTLAGGFTYSLGPAPTVSRILPSNGPTNGGTDVTITGANFTDGATVAFGGTQAANVSFVSTTQLTATTPASATAGAADVNVINPDGQVGTLAAGFTFNQSPAPTVSGLSPSSGPSNGGTNVAITGINFASGATVAFGDAQAANSAFVSATQLTAATPTSAAVGAVNVTVTNPDGQVGMLANGFAYNLGPAPAVSGLSPASGPSNGGTNLTIAGTNFSDGATVDFGGTQAGSVSFVSATQLLATTPAHAAGAVDVDVVNPDGQVGTLAGGFAFSPAPAPAVSGIAPASGTTNGGMNVTLSGTGFADGAAVDFGGAQASNVVFVSATQLTAATPTRAAAGAVNVNVTNPDGQVGTLANGFTYSLGPAPTVSGIAPSSGPTNGGTNVTVTGTGFADGATVDFSGTQASNVVFVSATQFTATTPAGAAAGTVDVNVTNPDGQVGTLAGGFAYYLGPAPALSGITPANGPTNGGTNVTLTGTNFADGALVYFGDMQATSTSFVSATRLLATAPAHAAGAVDVNAANPDGQVGALAHGFTFGGLTVTNPLSGIAITLLSDNGGAVALQVSASGGLPSDCIVTTQFGSNNGTVAILRGTAPAYRFTAAGIYLAAATAVGSDGTALGRARLMLPISAWETGAGPAGAPPASTAIGKAGVKGKFLFNSAKPDEVSFTGTVVLPQGMDLTKEQACAVGLGNVVDSTVLSVAGKAKTKGALGRLKALQIKYPRLKKPATATSAGQKAALAFTLGAAALDVLGFDTEGITNKVRADEQALKPVQRSIQAALLLGGTTYRADVPVDYKLSKKGDTGQISTRKGQ